MELQHLPYRPIPIRLRMPALQAQDMPALCIKILGKCEQYFLCHRRALRVCMPTQKRCRLTCNVKRQMHFKHDRFWRCTLGVLTRWAQVQCTVMIGDIV
jgi:hypothetical protein